MTRSSHKPKPITLDLVPPGAGGLDMHTHESLLQRDRLRIAENVRTDDHSLSRRPGAIKIAGYETPHAAWSFGNDTTYAEIPAALQLQGRPGGFVRRFTIEATRPTPGQKAWIHSSEVPGTGKHVLSAWLDENGILTVGFRDFQLNDWEIASNPIADGAVVAVMDVLDVVSGTYTLYVDGKVSGTPIGGFNSNWHTDQSSVNWYIGINYDSQAGSPLVNTFFSGRIDAFTFFSLRGTRPALGNPTLIDALRRWTFQTWPNPTSDMVLAHYDFNDEILDPAFADRSRFKNHATRFGTPTRGAALARRAVLGNHCALHQRADGMQANLVSIGGRVYYEVIREGAS